MVDVDLLWKKKYYWLVGNRSDEQGVCGSIKIPYYSSVFVWREGLLRGHPIFFRGEVTPLVFVWRDISMFDWREGAKDEIGGVLGH